MNSTLETAQNIRRNVLNGNFVPSEFKEFQDKYPKFYEMLQRRDMNVDMFHKIIQILSVNLVDELDAASQFSQYGAEKYVYPKFGKPSETNIEKAKKKLEKRS